MSLFFERSLRFTHSTAGVQVDCRVVVFWKLKFYSYRGIFIVSVSRHKRQIMALLFLPRVDEEQIVVHTTACIVA
jgi:hypothetical protein